MGKVVLDINNKPSHAEAICISSVEFQCRPATAEFMCEALRSMHPMKEHDGWTAWIWAGVCALVCTARRAPVSEEQCRSLFVDQAALLNALAK